MAKIIIIDDMGNTLELNAMDDECMEIRNEYLNPCGNCGNMIVLEDGWDREQDCCNNCAK